MMDLQSLARGIGQLAFRGDAAVIAKITPVGGGSFPVYRFEYAIGDAKKAVFAKRAGASGEPREAADHLKHEYEITRSVKMGFPETRELRTVSPVGLLEDSNVFVTWEIPGISLQERINTGLRWRFTRSIPHLVEYVELAGQWLGRFHGMGIQHAAFDPGRQFEYCAGRLHFLAARGGLSHDFAESLKSPLAALIETLAGRAGQYDEVLCHNDFSPHNIIVHGEGLCVLDFSFSAPGLRLFDAACFWHKLEDLKVSPLYFDRTVETLQRRFLAACDMDLDPRRPEVRLALLRLVLSKMATLHLSAKTSSRPQIQSKRRYSHYLAVLDGLLARPPARASRRSPPQNS